MADKKQPKGLMAKGFARSTTTKQTIHKNPRTGYGTSASGTHTQATPPLKAQTSSWMLSEPKSVGGTAKKFAKAKSEVPMAKKKKK